MAVSASAWEHMKSCSGYGRQWYVVSGAPQWGWNSTSAERIVYTRPGQLSRDDTGKRYRGLRTSEEVSEEALSVMSGAQASDSRFPGGGPEQLVSLKFVREASDRDGEVDIEARWPPSPTYLWRMEKPPEKCRLAVITV